MRGSAGVTVLTHHVVCTQLLGMCTVYWLLGAQVVRTNDKMKPKIM